MPAVSALMPGSRIRPEPDRRTAAGNPGSRTRRTSFRPGFPPGAAPPRRNTGRRTAPAAPRLRRPPRRPPSGVRPRPSRQQTLVGPPDPGGELLSVGAIGLVAQEQPLDVVGQRVRGHLQPADLAPERRVGA